MGCRARSRPSSPGPPGASWRPWSASVRSSLKRSDGARKRRRPPSPGRRDAGVSAIHTSTSSERDVDGGSGRGHLYARNSNPNRDALEHCLADLEGGLAAAAFGSGTAATMAVFQALAPGDHVIAPHDLYSGTARLLSEHMSRWGLDVTFADATRPEDMQAALRTTTRLVWIETPSNPMLRVTDIAKVTAI